MKILYNFRFSLALVISLVLMQSNVFAQETKKITGAKGQGIIAGKITPAEAQREALNQAKVEALRMAGVTENLQSYQTLFKSEVNNDFSEFFSSDVQAELQGAVKEFEVVKEERRADGSVFIFEVTINATVILYDAKPDPTFNIRVEGVKGIYEEGENLTFSIFSTKDCYLHIFGITDAYTSLLYPNSIEELKMIEASKKVEFPLGNYDYPLFKSTKEPELTRVVFVFTKEPVKYLNFQKKVDPDGGFEEWITNSEDIFSWVYSMMPDMRKLDYQVFTVR